MPEISSSENSETHDHYWGPIFRDTTWGSMTNADAIKMYLWRICTKCGLKQDLRVALSSREVELANFDIKSAKIEECAKELEEFGDRTILKCIEATPCSDLT